MGFNSTGVLPEVPSFRLGWCRAPLPHTTDIAFCRVYLLQAGALGLR
jgi:hypothetical protein